MLLELTVLAIGARWGWALDAPAAARLLTAVAVPLLLAGLWGVLGSPRARVALRPPVKRAFQAGWFVLGGGMLALLGQPWFGVWLVAAWVAVAILLRREARGVRRHPRPARNARRWPDTGSFAHLGSGARLRYLHGNAPMNLDTSM
ncbi:YrdB family protein [Micromonospora sp. DT44]|uniref:YrdB family protein n=1 Tax=Micromonospora sp. DT44 TaxID=3393439 RepID=UPI003CFA1ADF